MTSIAPSFPSPTKSAVALLLTFVAGSVDAVGYLTLGHVFTAHVTGATANLGISLRLRDWQGVLTAAIVVAAFLMGSILGRVAVEIGARARLRRIASITLGFEALLLAVVIVEGRRVPAGQAPSLVLSGCLLAALAGAMGVQTATLTRVGPLTIHTTFVTGMLNKLAQQVSHGLFETYALHHASADRRLHFSRRRAQSLVQARLMTAIWCLYLGGAVAGASLELRSGPTALVLGIALLMVAIAVDWIRPLSLEEEADPSER